MPHLHIKAYDHRKDKFPVLSQNEVKIKAVDKKLELCFPKELKATSKISGESELNNKKALQVSSKSTQIFKSIPDCSGVLDKWTM